jgi:hypothetical protein
LRTSEGPTIIEEERFIFDKIICEEAQLMRRWKEVREIVLSQRKHCSLGWDELLRAHDKCAMDAPLVH